MANTKKTTNSYSSTRIVISQDLLVLYVVENDNYNEVINNTIDIEKEAMYDVLVLLSTNDPNVVQKFEQKQINYLYVNDSDLQTKLKRGFEYAINHGYKFVVQLDDDGQYNWKEIVNLHQKALKGNNDVVIGDRVGNQSFSISKSNKKITQALKSFGNLQQIQDALCFFRLFNDNAIKVYLSESFSSFDPASYSYLKKKGELKFAFQPVSIKKDNVSWENQRTDSLSYATKQWTKILFGNVK